MADTGPQLHTRPAQPSVNLNRRLTLDIQVEDGFGKPVTGLRQQDFAVLDNLDPAKVLTFSANGAGQGSASAEPVGEIVFVLDAITSDFEQLARAKQEIMLLLKKDKGRLEHPVSIAWLTKFSPAREDHSRIQVKEIQNKTAFLHVIPAAQDGMALARELDMAEILPSGSLTAQGISSDQVRLDFQALELVATAEVERPGRKLVIWISPGWPLLSQPDGKMQEQLFDFVVYMYDLLRRARITLDAVDPLGVSTQFRNADMEFGQSSNDVMRMAMAYSRSGATINDAMPGSYTAFLKAPHNVREAKPNSVMLQVLAAQTGGLVLFESNDLASHLARCVAEADSFYTLTYDAPAAKQPNEYHSIGVRVARAGVKVRTRSGYYAQPSGAN